MKWRPRLKIYQGSNNNTFDPESFEGRSYNHWLYVMKHKGWVIFNDYRYSVTTSRHQSEMKDFLVNELKINKNKIIFVNQHSSLTNGVQFNTFLNAIALATVRLKSKGKTEKFKAHQQYIIKTNNETVKQLKKLGFKPETTLKDCLERQQKNETYRLERARTKSQAARAKKQALMLQYKEVMSSVDSVNV